MIAVIFYFIFFSIKMRQQNIIVDEIVSRTEAMVRFCQPDNVCTSLLDWIRNRNWDSGPHLIWYKINNAFIRAGVTVITLLWWCWRSHESWLKVREEARDFSTIFACLFWCPKLSTTWGHKLTKPGPHKYWTLKFHREPRSLRHRSLYVFKTSNTKTMTSVQNEKKYDVVLLDWQCGYFA